MARALRAEYPCAFYHVINCGKGGVEVAYPLARQGSSDTFNLFISEVSSIPFK